MFKYKKQCTGSDYYPLNFAGLLWINCLKSNTDFAFDNINSNVFNTSYSSIPFKSQLLSVIQSFNDPNKQTLITHIGSVDHSQTIL